MKRLTPAQLEFMATRQAILLKGEPALQVNGKNNPDWILWYRALHRVTTNIAKRNFTKRLLERDMEKEA